MHSDLLKSLTNIVKTQPIEKWGDACLENDVIRTELEQVQRNVLEKNRLKQQTAVFGYVRYIGKQAKSRY